MKILYFHQHFCTPAGSSGTRSYAFAKALADHGHQVTVVCGSAQASKTGLTTPFQKGMRTGRVENFEVLEIYLPYSNKDNFLKRTWLFLRFAWLSLAVVLRHPCDLVFATSTPLTAAIPGIFAKVVRRKPFVFEVRDLWPELPAAMGVIRNRLVLWAMGVLETLAYRAADVCIGLAPGIVAGIKRKRPSEKPTILIPNGCDIDLVTASTTTNQPQPIANVEVTDVVAIFTGAHGLANGLDAVLDAAAILKKRNRADIKIVLIGDGREKAKLVERANNEQLTNVIFHGFIPKTELMAWFKRADIGLQLLRNVEAFYYGTSPNKFFDYLATGLPVLTNYPGWVADLIKNHATGLAVAPDDPEAFAHALEEMADHREKRQQWGENARRLGESQFNRNLLAAEFVKALSEARPHLSRAENPT